MSISNDLVLKDRFSGVLDKYIGKLKKSVDAFHENKGAMEALGYSAEQITQAERTWGSAIDEASRKTLEGAKSLRTVNEAFRDVTNQMNSSQADIQKAFMSMDKAIRDAGLRWSKSVKKADRDLLLLNHSIDELQRRGALVAKRNHLAEAFSKITKNSTAFAGIGRTLRNMVLILFSARSIMRYMRQAVERAPDEISKPYLTLKETINNTFTRAFVSVLKGMAGGFEKINRAMSSEAGQKFARGLEVIGNSIGKVVGLLLGKLADLITWVGDHFQEVMTGAAIAATVLAAKFLIMAGAAVAAHWPIIAIITALGVFTAMLFKSGVTAEQVFTAIGKGAGFLYAFVHNLVANTWNAIAVFAEFLANVFNDPLGAIKRLFFGVFDAVLGIVATVANAIDALLGTDWSSAVSGFRDKMQTWADDKLGQNAITFERMDTISTADTMAAWGDKAGNLASRLSDFSLKNTIAQELKDISDDTGSIRQAVTDEDLKALIDMAERRFVSQVNLTAQTPVITINGQNTGNTEADRRALANTIRDMLIEQMAAGSTSVSYA